MAITPKHTFESKYIQYTTQHEIAYNRWKILYTSKASSVNDIMLVTI